MERGSLPSSKPLGPPSVTRHASPLQGLAIPRGAFVERQLWNIDQLRRLHSGLILAAWTTCPHFSVSPTMSLPKSAAEPISTVAPKSESLVLIFGSTRAALISLLSLSTIAGGVFLGAPTPRKLLAS